MAAENPFRGLIWGCALCVVLLVAFDILVLVWRPAAGARPVALGGAALAVAGVLAITGLFVTGWRRGQRTRELLAGDYLARWRYDQGEWQRFVAQERARTTRAALIFFPLSLVFAALLFLLSRVTNDPLVAVSIPLFLLIAVAFLFGLVAGRVAFAGRTHLAGDTYIGPLGVLRPDGYIPLRGAIYHLAGADLVPGNPSLLRCRLQLGRMGSVLAFFGNAPAEWEVRVPVPYGHEADAARVAAQLAAREPRAVGRVT